MPSRADVINQARAFLNGQGAFGSLDGKPWEPVASVADTSEDPPQPAPGPAAGDFRGPWQAGAAYNKGDLVVYQARFYQAKAAHVAAATWSSSRWDEVTVRAKF